MPSKVLGFGSDGALGVDVIEAGIDFLSLAATFNRQSVEFRMRMGGMFNVQNSATALALLLSEGYGLSDSCQALSFVPPVSGRFEPVPNQKGVAVIIDYAHTPDALEKLLTSIRPLTTGRIITVFGCGGDRDRTKRPLMGKVASDLSDLVVTTSDNPRTEDPDAILNDIEEGVDRIKLHRHVDRKQAVAYAVSMASKKDVVVLAGKGHENYQIIGTHKYPLDDRELVMHATEVLA